MKQSQSWPVIKHPFTIVLIITIVILGGAIFFLTQGKNQNNNTTSTAKVGSAFPHSESAADTLENPTYGHVHSMFRYPQDGSLLMGTHQGLFKSTDNGKTFTKVDVKGDVMASDFMNFAYDPNSKTVFAGGHDLGVVKSTDGGVTWEKADSGITGSDIHALAINPLDSNRLYAFSVDNGVFGTKDNAASWYRIDDGPTNPSVRAFGYMGTPSSMDRSMKTDKTTNIGYLWAGTGGGLYSSFACFCGWNKSMSISDNSTIYALTPDPANKSNMLAGTKDGIFKTTDEGKTFTNISDIKNIAAIVFDQENQKKVYAATEDGMIYTSLDSGTTWSKVN